MTAYREWIEQAHVRGITLRLDDAGNLAIGGDYTDKFLAWAKAHKTEIVAELSERAQHEDTAMAVLDRLHAETLRPGAPVAAARVEVRDWLDASGLDVWHFDIAVDALQRHGRIRRIGTAAMPSSITIPAGTCTYCAGGGCRACDFRGLAP